MTSNFVARGAAGYDGHMGRWSQRLAPLFLEFAGIAPGEWVLDVGCGTGNLSFALAQHREIAAIEAIDYEAQFVDALRQRNTDPRIKARQGDACALPFESASFDRVLSLLVLHFVSDPWRATSEMRRVCRTGGVAAAAVWDLYGGFGTTRIFWDTVAAIDPAGNERRGKTLLRPMTQIADLREAFTQAAFTQIIETTLTIRMEFSNFDDYWVPFMTGQGTLEQYLASMPASTRERVQSGVRAAYLCDRPDGPRSFAGVAWAVRGVAPRRR